MSVPPRVNYDRIAHLYDAQPYRQKTVDPDLVRFLEQRPQGDPVALLDLGCGTGNQLVANRAVFPMLRLVGVDRFRGMLRQAQPKAPEIAWVQADSAAPPFRAASFDFITCQYAFHHVHDKGGMVAAVFRLLRLGGRFVPTNLCPQAMADGLLYQYFPIARTIDLQDFWSPEIIGQALEHVGFQPVQLELTHHHAEQDLRTFVETVRHRDTCSQLMTIPDRAYRTGVQRLEQELQGVTESCLRPDHVCLLTIRAEKL